MPRLGTVECELTSRCNLRCTHCYTEAGESAHADLPVTAVMRWMDELVSMNPEAFDLVGGEPFLYPGIWQILEHAQKIGLPVIINTNGTLIDRKLVQTLKNSNSTVTVAISLDGAEPEINDAIRGCGSFSRTLHGMDLLRNAGFDTILMNVINRLNWRTFDKYVELAIREGIETVYVDRFIPVGRGQKHLESLDMPVAEWRDAIRIVQEVVNSYKSKIRFYVEESLTGAPCTAGRSHFSILWDGTVVPCGHFKYYPAWHLGNALNRPLKELFAKGQQLVNTPTNGCSTCTHYPHQCHGGCKGAALAMTGSPTNPDPVICTFFKGLPSKQSLS